VEPYNTKDEAERAALLKRQREARKAYSASQELGDETEAQVDAVMFVASDSDAAQAKFLRDEGETQERLERACLYCALIGGLFVLTVFVGTLMWAGVL
jgi:phage-related protein